MGSDQLCDHGSPIQQFTSVYGTTSQIKVIGAYRVAGPDPPGRTRRILFGPGDAIIVIVALFLAWRSRDFGVLAPWRGREADWRSMCCLIEMKLITWFRYFITAVPLEVLLVGSFFATGAGIAPPLRAPPIHAVRARRWSLRR